MMTRCGNLASVQLKEHDPSLRKSKQDFNSLQNGMMEPLIGVTLLGQPMGK